MVHLEVTGKENRGLRMAKRTRDKQREALRDLDKGLTDHVGNWTRFLKRQKKKKKKKRSQEETVKPLTEASLQETRLGEFIGNRISLPQPWQLRCTLSVN